MKNTIAAFENALILACERIADGPQEYHEAKTATDWAEHFMSQTSTADKEDKYEFINVRDGVIVGSYGPGASDGRYVWVDKLPSAKRAEVT